mmetsp:Transcript_14396/g.16480  ORF Transcript_14396/g.16480 Transcript_14396/m.16480 type:complete len:389 (-) Transcript_14396:47-1213(-)
MMLNSSIRSISNQSSSQEAIEEGDDELFQSMMQKLKPVSDDLMNKLNESLRCDGSISELSHCVNDSARGYAFNEVYDQEEELGEGGFAIVYRCIHKERLYSYAVKVVFNDNYEVAGEDIKEEINALKKLRDGPYIVRLFDVFTTPEQTHLVMEQMKGGDLLARLYEKEVFTENESRRISRKLIEAIFFCHKKHIAHRDIKLENILLSDRMDDTKIKLADFGCSHTFTPGKKCLTTLCGSPQYAAPELYLHDNGYDEKCDLWSAGVVIFALLGGYAPFEGSAMDLPRIVCEGYVDFSTVYWEHISDKPKNLIKTLLMVDPEDRATIEDVLDSEWLRRKDKESVMKYSRINLDGSYSNTFDAWVRLQNESNHSDITHRNDSCKSLCAEDL